MERTPSWRPRMPIGIKGINLRLRLLIVGHIFRETPALKLGGELEKQSVVGVGERGAPKERSGMAQETLLSVVQFLASFLIVGMRF